MSGAGFIDLSPEAPEADRIEEVAAHLRNDGLLAYPTETVYGFGCLLRPAPLDTLFRLKRGAAARPMLLLVRSREDVAALEWSPGAEALAAAFWPGPLTLVLPDPEARYPREVRSASGGVAIRQTPHPVARALLEVLKEPLTSTSANAPGRPPAMSAKGAHEAARELFGGGELMGRVRVVNGGTLAPSESSTIVDFSGPRACLRRRGVISLDTLKAVYPEIDEPDTSE